MERQLNLKVSMRCPVEKVMVWLGDGLTVFWECHDGVRDQVEKESCGRLYKLLDVFKPKSPFIYVKPNFSESRSSGHRLLAEDNGGRLITCGR